MDKKVKDISSQIDILSDNLNKNFLTTVGASIVTVLGYLSKPSRNLIVYIIGRYIAYILLNSILISITTKSKFNNIIDNYENWISSFGRLLEVKLDNKKRLNNVNNTLKNTFKFYWYGYILFNILIICAGVFCLRNLSMLIRIITNTFK